LWQDNAPNARSDALAKKLKAKSPVERIGMSAILLRSWLALQDLQSSERGQDLVEYSLLVCLIALGCIAGVRHVATAVSSVFSNVSSSLA
jgi:Flp pilus assembly pilin Flp